MTVIAGLHDGILTDILERFEGEPELLREVDALFALSVVEWQLGLRNAVLARDLPSLVLLAHAVKGSVSNLTMSGARATAAELEAACRLEGSGDIAALLVNRLVGELDTLAATLHSIVESQAGSGAFLSP